MDYKDEVFDNKGIKLFLMSSQASDTDSDLYYIVLYIISLCY